MRIFPFILSLILAMHCITACGLKEEVVVPDTKTYLWFTGDTKGAKVYIDDASPFSLRDTSDRIADTHYEIRPGRHRIIVQKNGQVVVDRDLLLGNGSVKEIKLP